HLSSSSKIFFRLLLLEISAEDLMKSARFALMLLMAMTAVTVEPRPFDTDRPSPIEKRVSEFLGKRGSPWPVPPPEEETSAEALAKWLRQNERRYRKRISEFLG
ncbi:hypothetical protein BOX15_Mlig018869g1, partial [Macrostomum lignano]